VVSKPYKGIGGRGIMEINKIAGGCKGGTWKDMTDEQKEVFLAYIEAHSVFVRNASGIMRECPYCGRRLGYSQREYIKKKKWLESLNQEQWNWYIRITSKMDDELEKLDKELEKKR